jgi:regulator of RNase E activity RraA
MISPALPMNDSELFELMRRDLFSAVIGDVLDSAGLTRQFLPPGIGPLDPKMILVGRAMPVLEADCFSEEISVSGSRQPFGIMFRALDDLKPNEVYICTGSSWDYALWGELMSTRARHLGSAGAVVDGYSRDTAGILRMSFPTFSRGTYAQDQRLRGRVVDFRCLIGFSNGAQVQPGDVLFGDVDGVVVIPQQHLRPIIQAALDKVFGENNVAAAIRGGMSTQEAWDKYGIM